MEQIRIHISLCRVLRDNHVWQQKGFQGEASIENREGDSDCPSEISNSVTSAGSLRGTTTTHCALASYSSAFPCRAPALWTGPGCCAWCEIQHREVLMTAAEPQTFPHQHFFNPTGFAVSGSRSKPANRPGQGPWVAADMQSVSSAFRITYSKAPKWLQKPKCPVISTSVQSLNCFDFQKDWGYSDVYSLLKTFPLVFNK